MRVPSTAAMVPGDEPAGRRWLMWGLPTLLFFVAFLHRPAPGVLAKDLMQAFDADGTIVGLLAATYFYAYAALMIPAGLLIVFFLMGVVGGAFVLTWPIGREVNPPHLAGVAVAVVNMGGFLGAALTQGPLGAVLDAGWAGVVVAGARVYPVGAYRTAFALCAAFALAAALTSLLVRETRGQNVHGRLVGAAGGRTLGTERPA